MVKHLVDFHGSPLAPRIQRHTLDTSPILLPLLLREKEIPVIQKSLERAARNTFMDGCPRQKNYSENGEFATTSAKFGVVNPST